MTSPIEAGLFLEGFELLTKLSSGGMGDVLLARRLGVHGFEKLLAIKTIKGELARRPDIRAMFLDEARLVARLDHPNIAQVYDFGEQEGTLFLAMEYVPGIALNKLLAKRGGPLPAGVAMRIVSEILRGLHAAHELTDIDGTSLGVVHRDVSPGNLILTFDGRMKILDFGIAIMNGRESPDTVVGELKGKPSYMAPEHLRAERVDRRADLYSASVVLHELLTGRKLFTRDTVVATVHAVENTKVAAPSTIAGPLPAGLDELVLKGLEKKPEERFADGRAFAAALDKLIAETNGETIEAFVERELGAEREQHKAWLLSVLHAHASGADDPSRTPTGRGRAIAILDQLPPRGTSGSGRGAALPATSTMQVQGSTPVPRGTSRGQRVFALSDPTVLGDETGDADVAGSTTPVPAPRRKKPVTTWLALGGLAFLGALVGYQLAFPDPPPAPEAVASEGGIEEDRPAGSATDPLGTTATATATKPVVATTDKPTRPDPPGDDDAKKPTKSPAGGKEPRRKAGEGSKSGDGAQSAATATTFGFVTIGAQPYALVRIDGQEVGVTPIMRRKLPVGTHEIQLVSPDSGEVRLKKSVTLVDGEHQRITYP